MGNFGKTRKIMRKYSAKNVKKKAKEEKDDDDSSEEPPKKDFWTNAFAKKLSGISSRGRQNKEDSGSSVDSDASSDNNFTADMKGSFSKMSRYMGGVKSQLSGKLSQLSSDRQSQREESERSARFQQGRGRGGGSFQSAASSRGARGGRGGFGVGIWLQSGSSSYQQSVGDSKASDVSGVSGSKESGESSDESSRPNALCRKYLVPGLVTCGVAVVLAILLTVLFVYIIPTVYDDCWLGLGGNCDKDTDTEAGNGTGVVQPDKPKCPPDACYNCDLCYTSSSDPGDHVTFDEAVKKCISMKGILAEPRTIEEIDIVHRIADSQSVKYSVWLGGNYSSTEGVWKWVSDGAPITVTKWAYGRPDVHGNPKTHCLKHATNFGSWFDERCQRKTLYLCQLPFEEYKLIKK